MKVAEAKDKAQTIDAILFDIAVTAVCGEASLNMKPDQQQVHAVVLSLYRHCVKMSSDETTAEEAFGTLTSLPWLGLSGCRWAEVESIMNLRSRKMSMVLNECMATLDVCATSYTQFVKYLLAPTLTLLSELQPEVASVESQKASRADWLVFWQNVLLTWAPSLMEASCYIPMAEKPAEFNVRMNLNQSDLDTLKKKADHLGVALPKGASKQQIVNKVLKAEVMSTQESMQKQREDWELRCIKVLKGHKVETASLRASMSAVEAALSEVNVQPDMVGAFTGVPLVSAKYTRTLWAACALNEIMKVYLSQLCLQSSHRDNFYYSRSSAATQVDHPSLGTMAGFKASTLPDLKAPLQALQNDAMQLCLVGPLVICSESTPPKTGYLTCTLKRGDTYLMAPLFSDDDEEDTIGVYITPPSKSTSVKSAAFAAWQVRKVNKNATPIMTPQEHIEVINIANRPLAFRLLSLVAHKEAVDNDEFKDEEVVALTRWAFPEEVAAKNNPDTTVKKKTMKKTEIPSSDDDNSDDGNDAPDQKDMRKHRAKRLKAAVLG